MSPPIPNLIDKTWRSMPGAGARLLRRAIRLADNAGFRAYLVGGPVRDLLLGRSFANADLSIEGDAPTLARELASHPSVRVVQHPRFLTATARTGDFVLDLVTARSETYEHPGALPAVTPGTIDDDLHRRDFTVNAMALALTGPHRGDLLDPLGGRDDLQRRIIRALHERSFQDDATRILRAARYAERLRFRIEPATEKSIRRDTGYLDTIGAARVHQEFTRTFDEQEPERVLLLLSDLGALRAIHPALSFSADRARAFANVRSLDRRSVPSSYWPLLAWDVTAAAVPTLAARLALRRPQAMAVAAVPEVRKFEWSLARSCVPNSRLVELMSPYPASSLLALAAATQSDAVRERIARYLQRLRRLKPSLTGDDIIAMGVPEGPAVGDILRRLHTAKLDGKARTRQDEQRLARELIDRPA